MEKESREGLFDAVAEFGKKYDLTTTRFMRVIGEKSLGEKVTRESTMQELIGEDYATMSDGNKNLIFTMLIKPDFGQAVELNSLKKISEDGD